MKVKELPGEKFEKIYNAYSRKFEAVGMFTFHNLLWQLIVNEKHKGGNTVLSTNYEVNCQELVLVTDNESGYRKTNVSFLPNINYREGYQIAVELSCLIWDLESKEVERIIEQSFYSHI